MVTHTDHRGISDKKLRIVNNCWQFVNVTLCIFDPTSMLPALFFIFLSELSLAASSLIKERFCEILPWLLFMFSLTSILSFEVECFFSEWACMVVRRKDFALWRLLKKYLKCLFQKISSTKSIEQSFSLNTQISILYIRIILILLNIRRKFIRTWIKNAFWNRFLKLFRKPGWAIFFYQFKKNNF